MPTSLDHQERIMPEWLDYDPVNNWLIVDGFKIARELLTQITTSPCGVRYRIIERADGRITVGYERDNLEAAAPAMLEILIAASHALKSYAYGNSSPDLALDIAIKVDAVIAKAEMVG